MSSTLPTFEDKYYEYGEKGIETKGLVIGGYESAFLADLVASYLFKKCSNQFKEVLWKGIYRYDGLLVFKGKKSLSDIKRWREDFQSRVELIPNAMSFRHNYTLDCWLFRNFFVKYEIAFFTRGNFIEGYIATASIDAIFTSFLFQFKISSH